MRKIEKVSIFRKFFKKAIDKYQFMCYTIIANEKTNADLAHLVERNLAKVEVAGSSPVIRSKQKSAFERRRIFVCIIHYSIFIIHYSLT